MGLLTLLAPAAETVARLNALSLGLRATSPVVPGEDPNDWEQYWEAVVAVLLSRLRGVQSFEDGG